MKDDDDDDDADREDEAAWGGSYQGPSGRGPLQRMTPGQKSAGRSQPGCARASAWFFPTYNLLN